MIPYHTIRHYTAGLLALIFFLFASQQLGAMAITKITITNPSPINIDCGSCVTLTVNVSYRYHGWEYLPQTGTLEIWENDWSFLDAEESIATASFTVNVGDPQIGTKTISVEVCCKEPNADGSCDFYGNAGTDDEHGRHEIYAKVRGKSTESPIKYAYCINDNKQASRHPDLPSYLNTLGLDAVAFSQGRTTMHVLNILCTNHTEQPALLTVGPYLIPADGTHQGYIIPQETEVEVPANSSVTLPLHGYCTDITRPPLPEGDTSDISRWIGMEDALPAPMPDAEPNAIPDAFEPRPAIDTAGWIPTYPGTEQSFPYIIDFNEHPREAAGLIFDTYGRIEAAYDSLYEAGEISTPFAAEPDKQRSEVIQQSFWIATSRLKGDTIYTQPLFTERMEKQFEEKAGLPVEEAPPEMQETFESGVEDFWSTFTTVGEGAKVLKKAD